jgi:DNA-binding transcriptional LysR family regulator
MNINTIDLNLMIAFDALISQRHVTKAGVAIGRSQPAMSNALSRLRELFEDQLLVKSGSKMRRGDDGRKNRIRGTFLI